MLRSRTLAGAPHAIVSRRSPHLEAVDASLSSCLPALRTRSFPDAHHASRGRRCFALACLPTLRTRSFPDAHHASGRRCCALACLPTLRTRSFPTLLNRWSSDHPCSTVAAWHRCPSFGCRRRVHRPPSASLSQGVHAALLRALFCRLERASARQGGSPRSRPQSATRLLAPRHTGRLLPLTVRPPSP
jgi:hypothetical protein